MTPSRMSTANQASGYWPFQASNSASIPSGGTPWRTLAIKPQLGKQRRSASVHKNIRGGRGRRASWSIASCSVTHTGRFGIGTGTECCHVRSMFIGSRRRMVERGKQSCFKPSLNQPQNSTGTEGKPTQPSCPPYAALSSWQTATHRLHPSRRVARC